ncbi:uncharacterized protein LOC122242553 [Penaeus japonicus]|uniref:uncharacterized protein LOC122242553 n=1 Tax=Penaeus japonicus TaxID=27405 RepID=UPI001C716EAB|nr:uncharacterized protein LOC122242553 [Penaeus japonicus]
MKITASFVVLALVGSLAAADESPQNVPSESQNEGKFFVKQYSTRTWTFLSSFTSTVLYTCYSTGDPFDPCEGRRFRRIRKMDVSMAEEPDEDLSGSLTEDEFGEDKTDGEKAFFRVWVTSSTTITVTTYSTNRSVTVSAFALCSYNGVVLNIC